MRKRIICILLLCCFSFLPLSVFASTKVAKIGETEYETVASAVNAATKGDVIEIISSASADELSLKSGVTLDIKTGITLTLSGNVKTEAGSIIKNNGLIVVKSGILDISKLSYNASGLVPNQAGTISIKENAKVIMLDAWADVWVPANDSHILTNCENGGVIAVGTKTFAFNGTDWVEANTQVKKGTTTTYGNFQTLLANVETGSTLKLLSNVSLPSGSTIIGGKRTLTVDLNGYNISAVNRVLTIQDANVTFTGKGKVYETAPDYGPIILKGSNVATDTNYSVVTVGKDVTLEGYYGIMITPRVSKTEPYGYGVVVNFNGTINALNDQLDYEGQGIYINGQIQHKTNYPIININNGSKITSTGPGVYAAGYGKWNITGSTITGVDSGLAIKSGIFNITNTSIKATGAMVNPPAGYSNGINASGAAIQIESNKSYAGDVEININSGTFTSENGTTLYEYVVSETTDTKVKSISITGGTFTFSRGGNIVISEELSGKIKGFITGGSFSDNVKVFVAPGYQLKLKDLTTNMQDVTKITLPTGKLTVSGTITNGNNANVQLIQGGVVIKSVTASDTGAYSISDVAAGVYNIIATSGEYSITKLIEVKENLTQNLTIGTGSFTSSIAGSIAPNIVVGGLQEQYENKKVQFLIKDNGYTLPETKIKEIATSKKITFFDLYIRVDDDMIYETNAVIEMVIPFDLKARGDIEIFRYHNGEAEKFTKLTVKPTGDYTDKTYYLDKENNLIYIYSSKFSTYGIGYNETINPDTGDNIALYIILGLVSITSVCVIVKQKKHYN